MHRSAAPWCKRTSPPTLGDLVRLHYKSVRNSQPPQLLQCMNGFSGHEWVFAEGFSPRLAKLP
jgi:hypothetical protein